MSTIVRPMYGLSRIDQGPPKTQHGYYMRVAGETAWFGDATYGNAESALRAKLAEKAQDLEADGREANLRAALRRCVKAMLTIESPVPLELAMKLEPKFRELIEACRDAKKILEA